MIVARNGIFIVKNARRVEFKSLQVFEICNWLEGYKNSMEQNLEYGAVSKV